MGRVELRPDVALPSPRRRNRLPQATPPNPHPDDDEALLRLITQGPSSGEAERLINPSYGWFPAPSHHPLIFQTSRDFEFRAVPVHFFSTLKGRPKNGRLLLSAFRLENRRIFGHPLNFLTSPPPRILPKVTSWSKSII